MNATSKQVEYKITPDVSLLKKMACISGTIPNRVMELVDNAIDARIEEKKLIVEVNIMKKGGRQWIEVIDNGCGMDELTARNYLKLGKSDKKGQNKIGHFGLGAKVAILGLGDSCEVETTPIHHPYAVKINFDIRQFKDWKIQYDLVDEQAENHGTKIKIMNLSIRIGDVTKFSERLATHFSKTYKHFIQHNQVEILINGKKVEPNTVELLKDFYQEFDFEINGKRVYGWAGATVESGTNWKFGLDLIANGRIIKGNDLLSRQAHTSLSRLVGEVHLNDFETDVHKTDFMRDKEEFQLMQEQLLEVELAKLIANVSKLTNNEVFDKYQKDLGAVSKNLNKVLHSFDFLQMLDIEDGIFKQLKKRARKTQEIKKKASKEVEESLQEILEFINEMNVDEKTEEKPQKEKKERVNPGLVINEPVGISLGEKEAARRWSVFENEQVLEINIEVNLDHPTYQKLEEQESMRIMMRSAVLDSIAEFILREEKKQVGYYDEEVERLNYLKDMLIRHSLKVS